MEGYLRAYTKRPVVWREIIIQEQSSGKWSWWVWDYDDESVVVESESECDTPEIAAEQADKAYAELTEEEEQQL